MKSLVLASGNRGKRDEIQALLEPLGTRVVTQAELGLTEAEEPYDSFRDNALAKARHACFATRLPALADDSGICVDALGGAPGVYSARYAGEPRSDARNNEKMLLEMKDQNNRRAHYACVLVVVTHADDPEPVIAEGRWHGRVVDRPRGRGGFGYDPHFEDLSSGLTGAELPLERKNQLSHRGKAMRELVERLVERGLIVETER